MGSNGRKSLKEEIAEEFDKQLEGDRAWSDGSELDGLAVTEAALRAALEPILARTASTIAQRFANSEPGSPLAQSGAGPSHPMSTATSHPTSPVGSQATSTATSHATTPATSQPTSTINSTQTTPSNSQPGTPRSSNPGTPRSTNSGS